MRIAFIPIDDRPATMLFPQRIAAICGVKLDVPPSQLLGHFVQPGNPSELARWLLDVDTRGLTAVVVSTDMMAYGGLVASREPATSLGDALGRLRVLSDFHRLHPEVPIYAFGALMRLAPTVTSQSQAYVDALTRYAQLAGANRPSDRERVDIAAARSAIPDRVFWDYAGSRARDLKVDESLVGMTAAGDISLLALTQDDAGTTTGLQGPEHARLRAMVDRGSLRSRVFLNPGTDEMGAVMMMRVVVDALGWSPSVSIAYPSEASALGADALEYLPIRETVANLAKFLKMSEKPDADFALAVNAPDPDPAVRQAFIGALVDRLRSGAPTAVVDLSFLTLDVPIEREVFAALDGPGLAAAPIAYASWNTTANSTGTALAEAAATLIGRRFATFDASAAATFLFERYVDDYGYRLLVRDPVKAQLIATGADVLALGADAERSESTVRAMLWPAALDIFERNFKPKGYRAEELGIYLPWQRTFEVRVDALVRAPGLASQ